MFGDPQMGAAAGCDLGRMGDEQDLHVIGHPRQTLADGRRGGAADAAVDLVEHQGGHGGAARKHHLERQHQPREFAARGDLGERAGRLAGVGGDEEAHLVGALGGPGGVGQRGDAGGEAGAFEFERREFLGDGAVEPVGGAGAGFGQAGAGGGEALAGRGGGVLQFLDAGGAGFQGVEPDAQRVAQAGQVGDGDAVFAGGGAQCEQAFLDIFEVAGIGFGLVGEPAQQGFGLGQRLLGAFQGGDGRGGRVDGVGRIGGDQALQRPSGGTQGGGRAAGAAVTRGEFGYGRRDRLGALFALLQALALGGQMLLLAGFGMQGAEFVDRVTQPFLVAHGLGDGVLGLGQSRGGGAPGGMVGGDGDAQARGHAIGIEQPGMGGRVGEAHLVMLALDLDEQGSDPLEQGGAHGLVVDEGP